jgi:hypothetical protein
LSKVILAIAMPIKTMCLNVMKKQWLIDFKGSWCGADKEQLGKTLNREIAQFAFCKANCSSI